MVSLQKLLRIYLPIILLSPEVEESTVAVIKDSLNDIFSPLINFLSLIKTTSRLVEEIFLTTRATHSLVSPTSFSPSKTSNADEFKLLTFEIVMTGPSGSAFVDDSYTACNLVTSG